MAHNYSNTASTATLDAPLNSNANTFTVTGFTGYPSAPFFILMDRDTSSAELLEVTAVAGSTLTAQRGAGGTAATAHSAGATIEHVIPAAVPQAVEQHIEATTNVHGVTGALVGASNEGTLSNKQYRGSHRHVYTDTLPENPAAGFIVDADTSISRDGFVAAGTGANPDRRGFLVTQSGAERIEAYYDGTFRVNPSGVSTRPAIDAVGTVRAVDVEVSDDLTVSGDASVTGALTAGSVNTGNLTTSGTFTSNGANALGAVTAAGLVTANAGLDVTGQTNTGQLTVNNGNIVLSGSGAKIKFPSSGVSAGTPGTAAGEIRYRDGGVEAWDGSRWHATRPDGDTVYSFSGSGTIANTRSRLHLYTHPGFGAGIPYQIWASAQAELNDPTPGSRYDLWLMGEDWTDDGNRFAYGVGPGFTQTGLGVWSVPSGGSVDISVIIRRVIGSTGNSVDVTTFNQMFTVLAVPY